MKKNIYGLFLLALTFSAQSCVMEEEDLFDESATERLENKKIETFNTLFDSQAGWVMNYFPTTEKGVIGCPFLVKFTQSGKDGVSLFAVQNDSVGNGTYMVNEEPSPFDIVFNNGPVLTFNAYNDIFHTFSDPKETDWSFDQGTGVGLGGDYEFTIIDVAPTEILLKGKKRSTYTVLRKFKTDIEGEIMPEKLDELWRGYMSELKDLNNQLYKTNPAPLRLVTASGEEYYLYNGESLIFDLIPANDISAVPESQKYIQTVDGIRFMLNPSYEGKVLGGNDYFFNEDRTKMVCEDGSYIDGGDPIKVFIEALNDVDVVTGKPENDWVVDPTSLGGDLKTLYDKIATKYVSYKVEFRFSANLSGQILMLRLIGPSRTTEAWRVLSVSENAEKLNFTLGDMKSTTYDGLVNSTPEIGEFFKAFDGKLFSVVSTKQFNMGSLSMVSSDDETLKLSVLNTKQK